MYSEFAVVASLYSKIIILSTGCGGKQFQVVALILVFKKYWQQFLWMDAAVLSISTLKSSSKNGGSYWDQEQELKIRALPAKFLTGATEIQGSFMI